MTARPRIVVTNCVGWPGNDATGPNRSLAALYEALSDCIEFVVIAPNRPKYGRSPIVPAGTICREKGVETHFLEPGPEIGPQLRRVLERDPGALLWLQSFFSSWFSIAPLAAMAAGLLKRRPLLLSPRGELSRQALAQGSRLKQHYLRIARRAGLFGRVALHATSDAEQEDIIEQRLGERTLFLACDTARLAPRPPHQPRRDDEPLRLAFVGRIHPMKGLLAALSALRCVTCPVRLDIWGPVQDQAYRQACEAMIRDLPAHVSCEWLGVMPPGEVVAQLAAYDLMVLPSESENFGHAIFESLSAGTPVLIGDRTPWRGLEQASAGWDLSSPTPERLAGVIDAIGIMPQGRLRQLREGARAFAERAHESRDSIEGTRRMLAQAAGIPGP